MNKHTGYKLHNNLIAKKIVLLKNCYGISDSPLNGADMFKFMSVAVIEYLEISDDYRTGPKRF